jgi:integrase
MNSTGSPVSPRHLLFENKKCRNCQPKKAATFLRNDVCKYLLEAADQEWILQKVVLMMAIFGGCRCNELCKMMNCYKYRVIHVR